jgi:hypothetical protein
MTEPVSLSCYIEGKQVLHPADEAYTQRSTFVLTVEPGRVHSLEGVGRFHLLQILVIRGNRVADLSPLHLCTGLTQLDASRNLITDLPRGYFWKHMRRLRLLQLASNFLTSWKALAALQSCAVLQHLDVSENPVIVHTDLRLFLINSVSASLILYPVGRP